MEVPFAEGGHRVLAVVDHPVCSSIKRPDFRIECDALDILVEHKLDAFLHGNQLEDYLSIEPRQPSKPTYVAFIAPSVQPVPSGVVAHPRYLKPPRRTHFRWSDFYPSVKSHPGWLAQEFSEFMAHLGLAPFTLKGPEDLFDDTIRRTVEFDFVLEAAARSVFISNHPGCMTKGTPKGRGREVRNPHSNISLVYAWASQKAPCKTGLAGPVLAVSVYERDCSEPCLPATVFRGPQHGIVVERYPVQPSLVGEGTSRLIYLAPLAAILEDTREATVSRMAEMFRIVRDDFWKQG